MDTMLRGTWFEAACDGGAVRLCLGPDAPAAAHAAEAAIRLQRAEDLLAPLDDWSGAALAWRPVEAPAPRAQRGRASARWRGAAAAQEGRVSWPWDLLSTWQAPPAPLAPRLEWPLVEAVLVLAELPVGHDELALLEPGGAVLLPQALQPPWHGVLRGAGEASGACVVVDLSTPSRPRLAARIRLDKGGE